MNEFEWDLRKAGSNLKKHGVSFAEALTVSDPAARIFDDPDHSIDELYRGASAVVVGFTNGSAPARRASRAETKRHDENT